jgi:hypothetical protein
MAGTETPYDAKPSAITFSRYGRFPGGSVSQLQEWCITAGLPYIRKLQSIYDDHHDEFERQVDAAKK